jgi:dipeptidyl aminopeptidase/acylaminoacyl peptidase
MYILRRGCIAVALACCLPAAFAADAPAARRPLAPDDFYRLESLSDPRVAPDGQWVAYVVTVNDRDADEQRSAVWMVSWDGTQRLQLTNPAAGTRAPRWSPDGRYLAFIATPAGADKGEVMLLDRRGGEPRPLTSSSDDISSYEWSPDGRQLVLVVQQSGEEAPETPKHGAAQTRPPKPIVIDATHFKEDEDGYLGSGHGQHLYLLDVATKKLEALTTDPAFNENAPAWSPDGRRIAFVRTHEKGADADGREDLAVVDARPGAAPQVLVRAYAPNTQRLGWSPDGALLAYLQGLEPKLNAYMQDRLAVVPAGGGAPRALSDRLDRAVSSYAFAADSASITITVEDDGSMYPARIDLASGAIERLVAAPGVVASVAAGGGHLAVLASTDTTAAELHALEGGRLRRLTGHNDALLAEIEPGAVEELRFRSRDGAEIHGLLVKPPGYVPGRRYPTVLWIHGGPNGQDEHSLAFDAYQFRRQLLAAGGYVVVGINYRGSSGRGLAFATAIAADWGHKEVEDLLAGADHVVASGLADPARLGIGGWSYGGILTDYTIAADRRFRAAVSGAGSGNQLSMYGSDEYVLQYNNELGPPWRNTALWLKVSYPFFHADRIRTPTLFMGGDKDFNVPIAGGEQMYEALRTLGVPTELVVYPGQYHGLTRPSFLKDRAERISAWFDRYLRPGR